MIPQALRQVFQIRALALPRALKVVDVPYDECHLAYDVQRFNFPLAKRQSRKAIVLTKSSGFEFAQDECGLFKAALFIHFYCASV